MNIATVFIYRNLNVFRNYVVCSLPRLTRHLCRNSNILLDHSSSFPSYFHEKTLLCTDKINVICTALRFKHSKKKHVKQEVESDSDEEEESEDVEVDDKISKVMSTSVSSLRVDLILKAGLGIARNKIETMFYESKIRVNGEKVLKKSYQCVVGDEVDIVRGPSPDNPEFLVVSRVEILSAADKGERLGVKLRRYKSLVVENYAEPWKSSQEGQ